MELNQNLNKENFFDQDLMTRYPVAMKTFGDWIDQYKVAVDWEFLFGEQSIDNGKTFHTYKFHDIPFEMQVGMILRFVHENNDHNAGYSFFQDFDIHDLVNTKFLIQWLASFLEDYDKMHNPDHKLTNPPCEEDDFPF